MLDEIKKSILSYASEERRTLNQRYFKTGPGEYGEGDIFIGLTMPDLRKAIKPFEKSLNIQLLGELLKSKEHEFRQGALILLCEKFRKNPDLREEIFNLYINSTNYINNWDLVDISAHKIVGAWLENRDRSLLYEYARSGDLWKERISIIGTMNYICKNRDFGDTLKISEILLNHPHDLIHKAVGWMLREIGKRSMIEEEKFLKKHYKNMPRTMLRYAIEKFPEELRQDYLKGRV